MVRYRIFIIFRSSQSEYRYISVDKILDTHVVSKFITFYNFNISGFLRRIILTMKLFTRRNVAKHARHASTDSRHHAVASVNISDDAHFEERKIIDLRKTFRIVVISIW